MLDWLTVVVMGLIGIATLRNFGAVSAVSFFCVYNFLCCLALLLVDAFKLTKADFIIGRTFFSAMPMEALQPYQTQVILTFFVMTVVALAAQIGLPRRLTGSPTAGRSVFGGTLPVLKLSQKTEATISGVGAFVVLLIFLGMTLYHFFSMDFSILWKNSSYLAIKSPDLVGLTDPLAVLYHSGFRIVGLAAIVLVFYYSPFRRPAHFWLCVVLASYAILVLLAGNSRWVPLYFFAAAGVSQLGRGSARALWPVLVAAGALSFLMVINGRSQSEFGISQIPGNLLRFAPSDMSRSLAGVFFNVFEGAINFANSIRLNPTFSDRYQFLSFSPFPSFVDGFSGIREADKFKFALHVPMGGYGEVFHFHLALQGLFIALMFSFFRAIGRFRTVDSAYIYYGLNVFSIYIIYLLPTYSLRTSLRYVLAVCIIGFVISNMRRRRAAGRTGSHVGGLTRLGSAGAAPQGSAIMADLGRGAANR